MQVGPRRLKLFLESALTLEQEEAGSLLQIRRRQRPRRLHANRRVEAGSDWTRMLEASEMHWRIIIGLWQR